jgi:hypothetical protein
MALCCPSCRLVQEPAELCRACGAAEPIAIDAASARQFLEVVETKRRSGEEVRRAYDERMPDYEAMGCFVSLLLLVVGVVLLLVFCRAAWGWVVANPLIAVFVVIVAIIAGLLGVVQKFEELARLNPLTGLIRALLFRRVEHRLRPAMVKLDALAQNGHPHRGVVRRWQDTVRSHLSDEECLTASLVICAGDKEVAYLRHGRTTDFVLVDEQGKQLVVTGEKWVVDDRAPAIRRPPAETPAVVSGLGLEISYPFEGHAWEYVLREEDRVEIRGRVQREVFRERAGGYRDGGLTSVLHGAQGEPLLIRRLL